MAELDIGRHCGAEHCNQLDFLPFVCNGCSGVFCLQHRSRASHGCSEVSISNTSVKTDENQSHPCTYKTCKARELMPMLCPSCEKHFCLGHRHQSDHECEKLELPQRRMAATHQLVKDIIDSKKAAPANKGRKGAKSSETAAKVALMKLKMHATGNKDLPQSERVYFQVFLPKEIKEKTRPMFFSSKWSLGKVVDFAASSANLKNVNNRSCAKVNQNISHGQALLIETLITFQLVFTVFASCDKKRKDIKVPVPLIIGFSVTIGHLFAISYTGASMNPARSFGTSLIFNDWHGHWVYWIGPCMGGVLAAFIYEYLFCPDPERKFRFQASFRKSQNQEDSAELTVQPGGEYSKLESSA